MKKCAHTIEGPNVGRGRKHPAWRRRCKRNAQSGSDYCWQHEPFLEARKRKLIQKIQKELG